MSQLRTHSAAGSGPDGGENPAAIITRWRDDKRLQVAMQDIYRRADAETAQWKARCLGGGACCRFDLAGHRLYASTAEFAFLTRRPPADTTRAERGRCPYQVGPRCTARQRRPLGCRTFFCDKSVSSLSDKAYEKYHAEMRRLHDELGIPYFYMDMVAALASRS